VIGAVGVRLNYLFLKFSRTDEEQADVVGARCSPRPATTLWTWRPSLGAAGQDGSRSGQGGAVLQRSPASENRTGPHQGRVEDAEGPCGPARGRFQQVKTELLGLSQAPTMQQIAQGLGGYNRHATTQQTARASQRARSRRLLEVRVFEQRRRSFQMEYPRTGGSMSRTTGRSDDRSEGGFLDTGGREGT